MSSVFLSPREAPSQRMAGKYTSSDRCPETPLMGLESPA